jgi:hypothetical protein
MEMNPPAPRFLTRRDILKAGSCGFGYLAFGALSTELAAAASGHVDPLASRPPHFTARAKRVIFMFMQGGPSHVDTFDHKPQLERDAGKNVKGGPLLPSPWAFQPRGRSGLMISDLYPALSKHADDLCLLNGMHTDNPAHPQATIMAHTGSVNFVRPSVGAWTLYGLGTENRDLPGFVTINPPLGLGGAQNFGAAFLPACYQGTRIGAGKGARVPNIQNPETSPEAQRRQLDLVQAMNRDFAARSRENSEIEGLIQSYELAFRMQQAVPEVMDFSRERQSTLDLYGIDGGPADGFGRQCLMARRFAEAGVRYIEICHNGWDQHNRLRERLEANARATDQPIAGLVSDLKQRGLLDETLLVWGGEFGRTPSAQGKDDGRRHNNRGYTMWLAGGGVRSGIAHGATDEHGFDAVDGKVHIHDLHATILHLLGLDHEKLTYRYAGRDFRLTDVYGNVVEEIIA